LETQRPFDARYLQGIEHFNQREFFEAHEVWEDQWRDNDGPTRLFLKGMIQAAVCLHHFGNGNTRGALKLYTRSRTYRNEYRPRHHGLNVDRFLSDMDRCCFPLMAGEKEPAVVEIDEALIPTIALDR